MITGKSKMEPDGEPISGGRMAKQMKSGKWRVYELLDHWTQCAGASCVQGPMIRDLDGNPYTFKTLDEAKQWSKTTKLI